MRTSVIQATGTPIEEIIYNIQYRLLYLSRHNEKILRVNATGIYGQSTYNSVKSFQSYYGIPVTGRVDFRTFTLLVNVYNYVVDLLDSPASSIPFTRYLSGNVVSSGQKFDLVKTMQIMLNTNSVMYDIKPLEENGIYNEETRSAIKKFQLINGIPPADYTDRRTWNRLSKAYSVSVNAE